MVSEVDQLYISDPDPPVAVTSMNPSGVCGQLASYTIADIWILSGSINESIRIVLHPFTSEIVNS